MSQQTTFNDKERKKNHTYTYFVLPIHKSITRTYLKSIKGVWNAVIPDQAVAAGGPVVKDRILIRFSGPQNQETISVQFLEFLKSEAKRHEHL